MKISHELVNRQVELSKLVTQLETILETIHSLYMNLCDVKVLTLENQHFIDLLNQIKFFKYLFGSLIRL